MKKILKIALMLLLGSSVCVAQTSTVTATVVDSDSTVWANATYSFSFQPGPNQSNPAKYTYNGAALSNTYLYGSGAANGSGVISITIYQNTLLSPVPSSYNLTVCPVASAPCATYNFTTSTGSVDISTGVNAVIVAPRFRAVSGSYGYNDEEAIQQLQPGSTYWNITSSVQRCYTGSAWGACSSGGGSGTISGQANNVIPLAGGATSITKQSHLSEDGTNVNSSQAITAPSFIAGTPSASAKDALPTGAHGISCDESATSGVPATGVDYIRCNSSTHQLMVSQNNGAETPLVIPTLVNLTSSLTWSGCTVTGNVCKTTSGGGTGITASGIPGTYPNLKIVTNGTLTGGGAYNVQFNGDTATNYLWQNTLTFWSGSALTVAAQWSGGAVTYIRGCPTGTSGTGNNIGGGELIIIGYTDVNNIKSTVCNAFTIDGGFTNVSTVGSAHLYQLNQIGAWNSTAAITSVALLPDAGTIDANATVEIYAY